MSVFTDMLGTGRSNPANRAMPYYQQIPSTVSPYYTPYINAGQNALNTLSNQSSTLATNPSSIFNNFGSTFTQSPGYQFQYKQGLNAANQAAAAGGMLGTPYHQEEASTMASNLANQDFYNYINQIFKLYDTGLQGETGLSQLGYQASSGLADILSSNLMNEAGLAYTGQAQQNKSTSDLINSIISGVTFGLI